MTFNCHNNYFLKRKCNESQGKPWLFCFSWEQREFGDIGSVSMCKRIFKEETTDVGEIPFYKIGTFGSVPDAYISRELYEEYRSKYSYPHKGDILLSASGTIGRIVEYNGEEAYFQDSNIVWLSHDETISNLFLKTLYPIVKWNGIEGSTIKRLYNDNFLKTQFMMPTLDEQTQIGAFFANLDHLITLHQREEKSHTVGPTCIATAWEQRKVGDLLVERNEQSPMSTEYPLMAFIANEGVAPKGDRYDRSSLVNDTENKLYKRTEYGDFIYSSNNLETGSIGLNKYGNATISPVYSIFQPTGIADSDFLGRRLVRKDFINAMVKWRQGVIYGQWKIHESDFIKIEIAVPSIEEQRRIGAFLDDLDNLITLHQREHNHINTEVFMLSEIKANDKFCDYYAQWISVYKEGAVRKVTMDKYKNTHSWLVKLIPELSICELNRVTYQQLLNNYARYHERQTTMDFHHQLKGAIQDAVDDGLIEKDPTRKAIIKGKTASEKKTKYLNQFELHTLLSSLDLKGEINWDWFILLVAKTGMRFSEALALTPKDFDFAHQTLSISKTWDYKGTGGFLPTKNKSSVRKIQIDWQTVIQFSELVRRLPQDEPIFVKKDNVYNSTVNDILERHCKKAGVPVITVHGLRHTHASLLLFAGVSIASVARRLGHASMTTTQKTYLHIIQELENQDVDLVMRSLSGLS